MVFSFTVEQTWKNKMNTIPMPHQIETVAKIKGFNGRALITAEPGTGKSLMALMHAYDFPALRPLVILCPASIKHMWEQECLKHFNWRSEVLEGTKPFAYNSLHS